MIFVVIMVILVTLFFKHLIFTEKGNLIRHKKDLSYAEKRASIESFGDLVVLEIPDRKFRE